MCSSDLFPSHDNADEIAERFAIMQEKLMDEFDEEIEALQKEEEVEQPSPKAKKKILLN